MRRPLAVVPTYIRDERTYELAERCVKTLVASAGHLCDVLVVDDCSPRRDLYDRLWRGAAALGCEVLRSGENAGFSRTANVGLRAALDEGRDAVLVNQDVEFFERGWLEALGNTDAWVVGGLLLFPSGLIQHAGVYFSVNGREFEHIYRFGPPNLPEAQRERTCPVTGALQLIRHECLALVGLYDEDFGMGYEDVDYCLRVFKAGRRCAYQPLARAKHHEQAVRGGDERARRRADEGKALLWRKHSGYAFAEHVPTMLEEGEGWTT